MSRTQQKRDARFAKRRDAQARRERRAAELRARLARMFGAARRAKPAGLEWDHYDYRIAGHYLSALINGDASGLEDDESAELEEWERAQCANAERAGWQNWQWDCDAEDEGGFERCEVSGLGANCVPVRLVVSRERVSA